MNNRSGKSWTRERRWTGITVATLAMLFIFYSYARHGASFASWLTGHEVKSGQELGAWGDSFGALNVMISALAFCGILITLALQRRGLEEQAADQHRQRFDASFFELLRLQREARRDMVFFNTSQFEAARTARSYQTFSQATTGRLPASGAIDPIAAAVLEVHFQLISKGILGSCSRHDLINAYMRYVHSASEATIAPYFRIIYSILDRLRADRILAPSEKIRYANLVRGQLSSAEILLLGINSLTPISADMRSLVAEFRMLKYLPNSSMRALLGRFHEPIAFASRDDPLPKPAIKSAAFNDERYRAMIAALHAERKILRLSRQKLAAKLRRSEQFVADYEDGRRTLGVADFVDVARALGSHPALFLRH
jgi:hypothetical protein